jgi:hypothetical protein
MVSRHHFVEFNSLCDHLRSGGVNLELAREHRVYVCGLIVEAEIYAILCLGNSRIGHGAKEPGSMLALMGNQSAMALVPQPHDCNSWGGSNGSFVINFAGVRCDGGVVEKTSLPLEL